MAEVKQGDTVRPHSNIAGEPWLSWVLAVRHRKTWPKKLAMGVSHKTFKLRFLSIKPPISLRCFVQSLSEPELLKSGASAEACKNMPPPLSEVWYENPSPTPNLQRATPKLEGRFQTLTKHGKGGFDFNHVHRYLRQDLRVSSFYCRWTGHIPWNSTIAICATSSEGCTAKCSLFLILRIGGSVQAKWSWLPLTSCSH